MSDMPDSMPEQHDYEVELSEQAPVEAVKSVEPVEAAVLDKHELAHAHDHPELVVDAVLDTDSPDLLLSKNRLENEGGGLESAYVVYETTTTEAELAEVSGSNKTPTRPQSVNELRIEALTRAIEQYPNTPTNYVLRGEVYLTIKQHSLAAADFHRALGLAEARVDELPWGYANAAVIDRAQNGLRHAQ